MKPGRGFIRENWKLEAILNSLSFHNILVQKVTSEYYRMFPSRKTSIILYNFLSALSRICTIQQKSNKLERPALNLIQAENMTTRATCLVTLRLR
jgi:hypothetical protein